MIFTPVAKPAWVEIVNRSDKNTIENMIENMIKEKIVIGKKYPLNGLLTIPQTGSAPFPAVVLVHGSGPCDMNEKVGNVYPFRDLAEGLAKRGIAAIRYDKRTLTHGKALMTSPSAPDFTVWDETIEDAIFAAEILRKDNRINPEKLFILGHSMGGMLAPRIDAEGGNFTGIIIWAGSPRKIEEIMIDQQNDFLKNANKVIKWITGRQIRKMREKFDRIYDMTDEEAKATAFFGKYAKLYYLKEWGEKPAINYLKKLNKPILVMHPSDDFHVSIEKDFEKYKEILKDYPNAVFKLYPGLNHCFMPTVYGDISKALKEYKKAQKVEEYVISDIIDWIKKT